MARFLRRYFWRVAMPAYWLCTFWLLISVFRITADGSGPTTSFYWGDHRPAPTLAETIRIWTSGCDFFTRTGLLPPSSQRSPAG